MSAWVCVHRPAVKMRSPRTPAATQLIAVGRPQVRAAAIRRVRVREPARDCRLGRIRRAKARRAARPRPRSSRRRCSGPIATTRSRGSRPELAVIVSTAARATPAAVPRQPACTARQRPGRDRPSAAGTQSATCTASTSRGIVRHDARPLRAAPRRRRPDLAAPEHAHGAAVHLLDAHDGRRAPTDAAAAPTRIRPRRRDRRRALGRDRGATPVAWS